MTEVDRLRRAISLAMLVSNEFEAMASEPRISKHELLISVKRLRSGRPKTRSEIERELIAERDEWIIGRAT